MTNLKSSTKRQFRTPYNFDPSKERKESNWVFDPETGETKPMPSCTVPDQTVSIKEIVDRTRKGQIISGALKAVYDSTDQLPDPRSLDYVERQEIMEMADKELRELKQRQEQRNAAKAAKKAQDKADFELFQAHLKKLRETAPPVEQNTNTP